MGCSVTLARIPFVTVLIAVSCSSRGWAQLAAAPNLQAPASAQGRLTVTATVVSSVGVVLGQDGQPTLIVANAASPGDVLSASVDTRQPGRIACNELGVEAFGVSRDTLKQPACTLSGGQVHSGARSSPITRK